MPIVLARIALVLGALLLLQSVISLRDGYRFLRYARRSRGKARSRFAPPAAVIIPCKGRDAGFERNLSSFLSQDYPHYQVVFVVASERDPAYPFLAETLREASRTAPDSMPETALGVAGHSEKRGEKVHNLVKGISVASPKAEILVFADIDAHPSRDWLRSLIEPLADPRLTVSTGFRWYLPGAGFVSQLRAAWDTSIATLLGDHNRNFAWGGSMALRTADFKRLRIAEDYWARTVSDDYAVTRAVRDAGGKIHFEPRCLLASRENSSHFLRWANRQIIITRVYAPRLWWMGLVTNALYCATILLGVTSLFLPGVSAISRASSGLILALILFLGLAKGSVRTTVARETFPEEREVLTRRGARYWQLAPLVPWVMLFNLIVAGLTRRIEWRGTHYELRSSSDVRVIRREGN